MKKENMIKVLKVEPNKAPYEKEVENDLKTLQAEVGGGLIEVVSLNNGCLIICNEESKINGMEPNRWLGDYDIICGPFFICGDNGEDFMSLTDKQIELCQNEFGKIPSFTGEEFELEPQMTVMGFDFMGGMK